MCGSGGRGKFLHSNNFSHHVSVDGDKKLRGIHKHSKCFFSQTLTSFLGNQEINPRIDIFESSSTIYVCV